MNASSLKFLKKLDLSMNRIRTKGLMYLANSPYLANLEVLLLDECGIKEQYPYSQYYHCYIKKLRVLSLS